MRIGGIREVSQLYTAQSIPPKTEQINRRQDELEISMVAKDYQYAKDLMKQVPEVRTEKVEQLKESIRSGNYSVNARELAEKMVSQLDLRG